MFEGRDPCGRLARDTGQLGCVAARLVAPDRSSPLRSPGVSGMKFHSVPFDRGRASGAEFDYEVFEAAVAEEMRARDRVARMSRRQVWLAWQAECCEARKIRRKLKRQSSQRRLSPDFIVRHWLANHEGLRDAARRRRRRRRRDKAKALRASKQPENLVEQVPPAAEEMAAVHRPSQQHNSSLEGDGLASAIFTSELLDNVECAQPVKPEGEESRCCGGRDCTHSSPEQQTVDHDAKRRRRQRRRQKARMRCSKSLC